MNNDLQEVTYLDKLTFISQIKPILKQMNYRKNGNYWYKEVDTYICCINVQGSQWDKNNYYVEIGFAFPASEYKNPTILQWYCCHRCKGISGEMNILPQELFSSVEAVFGSVSLTSQIPVFLEKHNAIKVGSQFWF